MVKRRLSIKLLLAFLALTLASLALSGMAINWALNRQFKNYIEENKEAENFRILDMVTAYYAERGTWRGIAPTLAHVGMSTETLIALYDHRGNLIYDSLLDMRGMVRIMVRMGLSQRVRMEQEGERFTYPIRVEGKEVGTLTLTLLGREGMLAQEDMDFSRTINVSIFIIAFLSGLGALATSLYLSRRLTRPLASITAAVGKLKEGDLTQRVDTSGDDELGLLAQAYNSMAEKLENTEKVRRKLAADISHELRTPLTTLKSYLEAFKDGVLPPTRENIESLQEEVDRLESLVSSLQELSLVENQGEDLTLQEIDPVIPIRKIFDLYRPLLDQKGIAARFVQPPGNVKAALNENALERIMHNLLNNAIKYTPRDGKIQVKLDLQRASRDRETVVMEISDTGSGIKHEDLPYIFERFYRADPSRTRTTGGFGIGLTIVRELVEAQGGAIHVRSRPGEGTIFTLSFPTIP